MKRIIINEEYVDILNRNKHEIKKYLHFDTRMSYYRDVKTFIKKGSGTNKSVYKHGNLVELNLYADNIQKTRYPSDNFKYYLINLFDIEIEGINFTFLSGEVHEHSVPLSVLEDGVITENVNIKSLGLHAFSNKSNELVIMAYTPTGVIRQWKSSDGYSVSNAQIRHATPILDIFNSGKHLNYDIRFDGSEDLITANTDSGSCLTSLGVNDYKGFLDRLSLPKEIYTRRNHLYDIVSPKQPAYITEVIHLLLEKSRKEATAEKNVNQIVYSVISKDESVKEEDTFKLTHHSYKNGFSNLLVSKKFPGYYELKRYSRFLATDTFLNLESIFFNQSDYFRGYNDAHGITTYAIDKWDKGKRVYPLIGGLDILDDFVDKGLMTSENAKEALDESTIIPMEIYGGLVFEIYNSPLRYALDSWTMCSNGSKEWQDYMYDDYNTIKKMLTGRFGFTNFPINEEVFPANVGLTIQQLELLTKYESFDRGYLVPGLIYQFGEDFRKIDIELFDRYASNLNTFLELLAIVRYDNTYTRIDHVRKELRLMIDKSYDIEALEKNIVDFLPELK